LNEAVARGDARRVIAFFRGFLQEAAVGAPQHGQERAAIQATGRKPVYTRAQIAELGRLRRKGAFNDAEWARWEAEIVAAGREGRIVGALHPVDGIPVTR